MARTRILALFLALTGLACGRSESPPAAPATPPSLTAAPSESPAPAAATPAVVTPEAPTAAPPAPAPAAPPVAASSPAPSVAPAVPQPTDQSPSLAAAAHPAGAVVVPPPPPAPMTPPKAAPPVQEAGPVSSTLRASNGDVSFTHKAHGDSLGCKPCHGEGRAVLVVLNKDSAHALCRTCHEAKGKGPVKCPECHKK